MRPRTLLARRRSPKRWQRRVRRESHPTRGSAPGHPHTSPSGGGACGPAPRAGTARPPGAPRDEGASAPSARTGRAPASAHDSSTVLKVKIKKKKPTQLSTLSHSHDTAPQRDSSTHHTPLHHSKVHPPHAAGWGWRTKHEEKNTSPGSFGKDSALMEPRKKY